LKAKLALKSIAVLPMNIAKGNALWKLNRVSVPEGHYDNSPRPPDPVENG
jgi:hypothetical protein